MPEKLLTLHFLVSRIPPEVSALSHYPPLPVPGMLYSCVWDPSKSSQNSLENHNIQDCQEFSKVRASSMSVMSVPRNSDKEKEEGQKALEMSPNSWLGGRENERLCWWIVFN